MAEVLNKTRDEVLIGRAKYVRRVKSTTSTDFRKATEFLILKVGILH